MSVSRMIKEQQRAVILESRMTAFLYSTKKLLLRSDLQSPAVSFLQKSKADDLYNLLQKENYFSANLAKCPVALVIRTEGKKKPLCLRG